MYIFLLQHEGVLIGRQTDFPSLVWPRFSYGSAFSVVTCAIQFWGVEDWNLGECGGGPAAGLAVYQDDGTDTGLQY